MRVPDRLTGAVSKRQALVATATSGSFSLGGTGLLPATRSGDDRSTKLSVGVAPAATEAGHASSRTSAGGVGAGARQTPVMDVPRPLHDQVHAERADGVPGDPCATTVRAAVLTV